MFQYWDQDASLVDEVNYIKFNTYKYYYGKQNNKYLEQDKVH